MKPELQAVQDVPISVREFVCIPFKDHYVLKNIPAGTFLFVDDEERALTEALKTSQTMSSLVQLYHDRYGKYSYKKILDLVSRLTKNSFLTAESEAALLKQELFRSFAPPRPSRVFIPLACERLGRLAGPFAKTMDSVPAIVALAALGIFSMAFLAARHDHLEFLSVAGRTLWGLGIWICSGIAVGSLKNAFKYFLLKGKGLAVPLAGIHIRRGFPCYHVDDSDILTLGWQATLRFHLASLLFPAFLGAPGAACFYVHPSSAAGIWVLACSLAVFLDISPFLRGELLNALDRLSGKYHLLESLEKFLDRKFAGRLISFGSTFQFEGPLIGYGIFCVLWMYGAYLFVSAAMEKYLERLTDVFILSDSVLERMASAVFIAGILFPLLLLFSRVLQLIAANLYALFEKPLDRIMNRLRDFGRRPAALSPHELSGFLKDVPLFANIPEEVRTKLAGFIQVESFGSNRTVVWQGSPGDAFYIIYRGDAAVFHEENDGRETLLAVLSSKDSFGEIALIQDSPRTATVKAQTPLICLILRRTQFDQFVEAYPGDKEHITKIIQWTAFLKELPMFVDLPPEMMARVILEMQERDVPKDTVIIQEGAAAEELFILRSGSAAVWKEYGRPSAKSIATLSAGDYFGEIALFDKTPRTATVVSREASRILVMPKESFYRMLKTNIFSGLWVEETTRKRKKELALKS